MSNNCNNEFKYVLNKIFSKGNDYKKWYDDYPSNFYNIELFMLIDGNSANKWCKHCNNNDYPIRLFNHCLKHISLLNIKDLYNDAKTQMVTLKENDINILRFSLIKIITKLKYNISEYKKVNNVTCIKISDNGGDTYNNKFIIVYHTML